MLRNPHIPITTLLLLSGCSSQLQMMADGPSPDPSISVVRGTVVEPLGSTSPAELRPLGKTESLRVTPGDGPGSALTELELVVGKVQAHTGPCSLANRCQFAGNNGTFLVDIAKLKAGHNEQIVIIAKSDSGSALGFVKSLRPWSFSGISAPVLLRVSGKASGFKLENLAPSLAMGLRRNLNSDDFRFVSLNALLTVYSLPQEEYALAGGVIADFSGYLQVGPTYHSKDKKWYLIVGIRPEILFGLIPRLQPKE